MDTTLLLIEERRAMRRWLRSGQEADLLAWQQAQLERESQQAQSADAAVH